MITGTINMKTKKGNGDLVSRERYIEIESQYYIKYKTTNDRVSLFRNYFRSRWIMNEN